MWYSDNFDFQTTAPEVWVVKAAIELHRLILWISIKDELLIFMLVLSPNQLLLSHPWDALKITWSSVRGFSFLTVFKTPWRYWSRISSFALVDVVRMFIVRWSNGGCYFLVWLYSRCEVVKVFTANVILIYSFQHGFVTNYIEFKRNIEVTFIC